MSDKHGQRIYLSEAEKKLNKEIICPIFEQLLAVELH